MKMFGKVQHHNWRRAIRLVLRRSLVTGIPELVATRSLPRRCLRSCVVVFCLFGFFYYTTAFLVNYFKYPTVMDVVVEYPDMVDIPAVTICSYNGLSATLFCDMYPELCAPPRNLSQFCIDYFYFCDRNFEYFTNISLPAVSPYDLPPLDRVFFKELGNKAEDIIESCLVTNSTISRPCQIKVRLISVIDTMGLPNNCYALNSYIGNVSREPFQMKSKTFIHLKLKSAIPDSFYTSTPSALQISIHSPRSTVNPFKKGFSIKPCNNYVFFISKVVNELLPSPYATNCTDYMKLWESRGGYGPLTQTQCREECSLNVSVEDANCVDPFYVSYPNEAKLCSEPAKSKTYFAKCKNVCNRACYREDITADVEEHASLLALNKKGSSNECFSIVTLAFNRMEVKTFSYYPKYQQVELFGHIGGYLGVWLGISLIAVSDVMETFFVIIKMIQTYIWRKRQKKIDNMRKRLNCYHADSIGNFRLNFY